MLALKPDATFGTQVLVRGVITAAEPDEEWSGRFFMQDETAGVFVENVNTNLADPHQPRPGDYVEVVGLTHPGGYAPIITKPVWKKLGVRPLPKAKQVPIEQLVAGVEDSQRVEIVGVVRAFHQRQAVTVFDIASGGYRLGVLVPEMKPEDSRKLIGARVQIRGTAATFFSGKLRHLITVTMNVPFAEDFVVLQADNSDPFSSPLIALNSLAQYRSGVEIAGRVHVRGIVTYQRQGEEIFIQDSTGGMQVRSSQRERVVPGAMVDVVGFPDFEEFLPILQDAEYRLIQAGQGRPTIATVNISELEGGYRHGDLISVQGRVIDSMLRQIRFPGTGTIGQRTVLTVQNSNFLFSVEGPTTALGAEQLPVPVGSLVAVSGVCLSKITADGKLQSLQVLLPSASGISILERPSWWTPERLLLGLAALLAVLIIALCWSVMVARKNAALKVSIREKEQAQIGLQDANNRLEERVKERTEQLHLQITARKEAELQFKAVLNERTRLAQELHDTLEQTLTGIALQMDTASKFAKTDETRTSHHLNLARSLVTQSQAEVRCSVWDLRSRSPEQIDLHDLLLQVCQRLTDDTSIKVQVKASGRVRPLPESIEENLLRIAQEALTNSIKHSKATEATISLDYGPKNVVLAITDNGEGFIMSECAGPQEGHFGLLGISERTSRLNGKVSIQSEPGKGTCIEATIPISPQAEEKLLHTQAGSEI